MHTILHRSRGPSDPSPHVSISLLFPSALTRAALNWFFRLEPGMVDSFRQRDDDPLLEYATRFSHKCSRCLETDDRAAFGAFKSGLRSSHFQYMVHSSNWHTYDELIKQVAIHAKPEYFNSKTKPSVQQEESKQQKFSTQKLPCTKIDKSSRYQPNHKCKDASNSQ